MFVRNHEIGLVSAARRPAVDAEKVAASGNIHDASDASEYGFAGAVVPGIRVLEAALSPVYAEWGAGWFGGGRIALRHRRPVYEDVSLRVRFDPNEHADDFEMNVLDSDGERVAVGLLGIPRPESEVPAMLVPPAVPVFRELLRADKGAIEIGCPIVGAPVFIDHETLDRTLVEHDARLSAGDRITSAGLLIQIAGTAPFDTFEYATPGMHYAVDAAFRAPARFGTPIRTVGVVVDAYERNGQEYFVALYTVADDEQVLAVIRQTVLYHMTRRLT